MEVGAYRRKLVLVGESWRLCAEVGAYRWKLVLLYGSYCFCAEVGALKFLKFSNSKKSGQNFKISKKLEHSSWYKILNRKS